MGGMSILKLKDANSGRPWIARLVHDGERYGRNFCLVHEGEVMVEFYDASVLDDPKWTASDKDEELELGQFVSRYFVSTLLGDEYSPPMSEGNGLDLQGNVPAWKICGETCRKFATWLISEGKGASA